MADLINYTNLFNRLNVLIKYFNILEARQVNVQGANFPLPYVKGQILDIFETQAQTDEIATIEADFDRSIGDITTLKRSTIEWFEAVLEELALELGEYNTTNNVAVLERLADAMTKDTKSILTRGTEVDADDVAADGTIKKHTSNLGNGKLIYAFAQPGITPNEISFEEFLHCECISAQVVGQESFQLSGGKNYDRADYHTQGSGLGSTLRALGTSVSNGDFEDWTTTAADEWTVATGTVWGTHLEKDTDKYEGDYCIESNIAGNWQITHAMPVSLLPDTLYLVGIWAKKAAGATGHVFVEIVDDNTATPVQMVTDELDIDISALTTSYTLKTQIIKTPASVSSAWRLSIRGNTLAVADCFLDLLQFGVMTKFNGIHFGLCSGNPNFGIGDKFGYGGDHLGIKVQVPFHTTRTADATYSDHDTLVFLDVDYTADFPVKSWVQHITDGTWHQVVTSVMGNGGDDDGDDDTVVALTPAAFTSFATLAAFSKHEGLVQRFLGRCFGVQLPSSTTPTQNDPT